jgi:outer membrane immunogenic protein
LHFVILGLFMKSAVMLAAAFVALLGAPAIAADMAVKVPLAAKAPAAAASSWTGCYGGINDGVAYGESNVKSTFVGPVPPQSLPFARELDGEMSPGLHPWGRTAGAQVGCNWQSSNLVAGVETDFDYMELQSAIATKPPASFIDPFSADVSSRTSFGAHWLYTLRGRLGVTQGDWLLYATGGLAATRINYNVSYTNFIIIGGPFPPELAETQFASVATTKAGWTVGGGVEEKIAGTRWSGKFEYLYADVGSVTAVGEVLTRGVTPSGIFLMHHVPLKFQILRAGFNYSLN